MWQEVTDAILSKDWGRATQAKITIEDQKRKEAADREANNETWTPKYFQVGQKPGIPDLTPEGRAVLDAMSKRQFQISQPTTKTEEAK
jgi:oxysterol-binding protein-related protein 9/10/11